MYSRFKYDTLALKFEIKMIFILFFTRLFVSLQLQRGDSCDSASILEDCSTAERQLPHNASCLLLSYPAICGL